MEHVTDERLEVLSMALGPNSTEARAPNFSDITARGIGRYSRFVSGSI